jgi:hypothetical protein
MGANPFHKEGKMSPRRRKQTDWWLIAVVAIIVLIIFLSLPSWLQTLIFLIGVIALIEFLGRMAFQFSPLGWVWHKIFG